MPNKRSPLSLAVVLGLAALVPFAVGVYVAWTGTSLDARSALRWLLPYLATVVAFIGGVQWGRMLAQRSAAPLDMALAVTPALIAWGALLTAAPWRGLLLLFALIAAWLIDEHGARQGWQKRGFLQLRRVLTLAVALCVIAMGWRVVRG
ncbi:hypothetical protein SAOR_03450 [Salinisphaera orenii MK-B5]|uniref:DUF3429 domain-containing protein n=2 Tax=Salinisphaera orenii TaxID=856731 RepID=A0A423PV88_9GAMM|nr:MULTISPECIES: DUF3429 domain-containing protein [Salinisphaera]ROO29518.1 hypothetical protein SAOR_03450 [Salinisphaera orenii MK-B5]ROO31737.1 hypothetical protein SAHL_06335 [Salinisphaera halophila YIM 95161]